MGGVVIAVVGAVIAVADQRISISPARRRRDRPRRGRRDRDRRRPARRCSAREERAEPRQQRVPLLHARRRQPTTARTCSRPSPTAGTSGRSRPSDLEARPLTGYGAGSFGPTYLEHGKSSETPAQAHGQLQELAATLGLPGLLLGSAVGAIGLAGLLRRRRQPSTALAGAAVGTACVLAHAQVDWHWQVPAVALPVIALVALGAALHPAGAAVPRRDRADRRRGRARTRAAVGAARLRIGAPDRAGRRPTAMPAPPATAATFAPFDPAPLRLAAALEPRAQGLQDALDAAGRGPREWSSWALVAQLAGKDTALVARACAHVRSENPRLTSCP